MGTTRVGISYEKLYGTWKQMRQRCSCPYNAHYKDYGGRGIRVCEQWDKSYRAFREWAHKNGYDTGLTIERINNNKGYSPDNCKWVTIQEQQFNKRDNRLITINGVTKTLTEWARDCGVNRKTIDKRLRIGWEGESLISPPDQRKRKDNIFVIINGEKLTLPEVSDRYSIKISLLHNRIRRRWKPEEIIMPIGYRKGGRLGKC